MDGWHSSGSFLVAVGGITGSPAESAASFSISAQGIGFGVEPLLIIDGTAAGAVGPATAGAGAGGRIWLLVKPPAGFLAAAAADNVRNPWEIAHRLLGDVDQLGPLAAWATAPGPRLVAIEPDVARPDPDLEQAIEKQKASRASCRSATLGFEATICARPSRHWPAPLDPAWHLSDRYSQLGRARAAVASRLVPDAPRVRVLHLDTGFDDDHVALPSGLDRIASLDFTGGGPPSSPATDPGADCFACNPGHGTGTLSLLAGNEMTIRDPGGRTLHSGALGGVPFADVRAYRIGSSVIHLTTGRMVAAFSRAIADNADVLSMSMGGLPSLALRDAVNKGYQNGVAMFAAAGDFLQPPLSPLRSPKSVVYPARFSRVIAVTGATADRKTYAQAPNPWSWIGGGVGGWALRGSYGPPSVMTHALAAFTPNVPWAAPSQASPSNLLNLDGAGTSASTPQVAAAAALWLEQHRSAFSATQWRSWEKTEAVYRALLDSADRGPLVDPRERKYYQKYFGAGLLRAHAALERAPNFAGLTPRASATLGVEVFELITSVGPFTSQSGEIRAVRSQLLNLEAVQLIASSVALQDLLGDWDGSSPLPEHRRRRLLSALAREAGASSFLRRALGSESARR